VATTFRGLTTSQADQRLFDVPLDLDFVRPLRLRSGVEGGGESLGNQPLADAPDRAEADAQGGDDLLVGMFRSPSGIRQQENAGMGELAGCTLAD
jgi:hypothetical protein